MANLVEILCSFTNAIKIENSHLFIYTIIFSVGAFLKKKVDYSPGFSSVFFKTTWSDQNSSTKSSKKFWEDAKMYLLAQGTEPKRFTA